VPGTTRPSANEQVDAKGAGKRCAASRSAPARAVFPGITTMRAAPEDLDGIDWRAREDDAAKWIGRSEGAEVIFRNDELESTTRLHDPSRHALRSDLFVMAPSTPTCCARKREPQEQAVHEYVNHALTESNEERGNAERANRVPLGRTVVNP